ncbi:BTAD domain-containing putative transcriptional regulator [Phytoactinopolyspora mesophila]|uniref:BTAD domain-containing putative transcriptional regulator n=1 Tax=Phytoactinopolyspora mesophila TaxID=2650750 RepID=UPI0013916014
MLGQLEVRDSSGRPLPISSPKQRLVLGVLLCYRDVRVSTEHLLDIVWSGEPPSSARTNLHGYLHQLRRSLGSSRIVRYGSSYQLVVGPDEADDQLFEDIADAGRQRLDAGDAQRAADLCREALRLWRAERAYLDLDESIAIRTEAARLEELRANALENRIEAELRLGAHPKLVPELKKLVATHPLRERLRGQLMTALYRCGRAAEALEEFRHARAKAIDELGLEPGADLRELERAILTEDPALDPPYARAARTRAVPAELPAPHPSFTGRDQQLAALTRRLVPDDGGVAGPPVVTINGPGGIGKSALARKLADHVADQFSGGHLYAHLRGATPGAEPLPPHAVLHRFLRALGVEESAIPTGTDAAAALFRSTLLDRSCLIMLDDAYDATQVRPLLPGPTSPSAVIVTSRRALSNITTGHHVTLGTLSPDESYLLLSRLVGAERIDREPEIAYEVARLCGHLPLAVQIAGSRLVSQPHWTLASLRRRLDDAQGRLDELAYDDLAVRASCDVTYTALPPSTAELLDHLGLMDLPDFTVHTAAALVDRPTAQVRQDVDRLIEAQLLTDTGAGRLTLHDLIRLYAREQASRSISEPDRLAAIRRVLHLYLVTARRAAPASAPSHERRAATGPSTADLRSSGVELENGSAAARWVQSEQDNIAAAAEHAALLSGDGPAILAGLAAALYHPFRGQGNQFGLISINQLALTAAQAVGNSLWSAQIHHDLSDCLFMLDRFDEARHHGFEALDAYRRCGERRGEAEALMAIGYYFGHDKRLDEAVSYYEQALAIHRDLGDVTGEVLTLTNLGTTYHRAGKLDEAIDIHEQALRVGHASSVEGIVRFRLAEALRDSNAQERALEHVDAAIGIFHAGGISFDESMALWLRGELLHDLHRPWAARDVWRHSLDLLCDTRRLSFEEADELMRSLVPSAPEAFRRGRP